MDMKNQFKMTAGAMLMAQLLGLGLGFTASQTSAMASGGGAGGGVTVKVDSIKVSKCYYSGNMLIKASSSDPTARLFVYLPSGASVGEVQNGGGSRYGGTVTGYVGADPGSVTVKSSSGGSTTVATTPPQI